VYQLKRLPFLNYTRHSSLRCVTNRKVKSLKRTVFLSEEYAVSKVITSVRSAVFRPWHRPKIVLLLVYCPVDNTLFEVSPEIRCSGVSSRYCCYRNHAAGSKPFINFFVISIEHWMRSISAKIINKNVNLWRYVILIVAVRFFLRHTVVSIPIFGLWTFGRQRTFRWH